MNYKSVMRTLNSDYLSVIFNGTSFEREGHIKIV